MIQSASKVVRRSSSLALRVGVDANFVEQKNLAQARRQRDVRGGDAARGKLE